MIERYKALNVRQLNVKVEEKDCRSIYLVYLTLIGPSHKYEVHRGLFICFFLMDARFKTL